MYVHDNTYIPPKILASLHFISLHFTSLPIFQFRPLSEVLSPRFKSVHFTPNFSLPATFRRFVITLQIRSLHFTSLPFFISGHFQTFYHHASNPFTSLHFTSLPIFHFQPLSDVLSSRFKSVHFTPHFSLPATFKCFIITPQIRSLHFNFHHFTSLHFTSLHL